LTNLSGDPSFYTSIYLVQVKPKHPDFKRKDGYSFWLGKDEKWVLPKLEGLQFDVPTAISKKGLSLSV